LRENPTPATLAYNYINTGVVVHKLEKNVGVAEKHNFCDIQQKIPQISDFAKKRDLNPPTHGGTAADIAKMFAKKFLRKSDFG
jgi:hypothetical protein